MAVAALLVLISFMGFCGAATRNTVLLKGFIFFVTFLLLVKIAIVVLLFVMQDEIRPTLTKLWNNSKDTNRVEFQRVFSCCDINNNTIIHQSSLSPTCFEGGVIGGRRKEGCVTAVLNMWKKHMILGVAVVAVVLFAEFLIVVLSCMLLTNPHSRDDDDDDDRRFVGRGGGRRDARRVHPMRIQVQGQGDGGRFGNESPEILTPSNAERRKWAKHSLRGDGKNSFVETSR